MKQKRPFALHTIGSQVVLRSGWNAESRSLVGRVGKVVYWKPVTVFENPNRNKVVFEDGSYVICDPGLLRPCLRAKAANALNSVLSKGKLLASILRFG